MRTIAVIDDHALVRSGLTRLVEAQGDWSVVHCGDSLEPLLTGAVQADVCLLDLHLNGVDIEPTQITQVVQRGSRVLVVSALESPQLARDVVAAGVDGIVAKSDSDTALIEALNQIRDGQMVISSLLAATILAEHSAKPNLTGREVDVLELYAAGLTIGAVARKLSISEHTVKYYLREIRRKFSANGLRSTTQLDLARSADEVGLIEW